MIKKVTLTPPPTSTASAVTLHDPANNTERFLSKIDGVVGPPAPRDVTRVRPGVDGVVDATAYLDARSITLEGELWKSTGGASLSDLSTVSEALYATMLAPGRLEVTYEDNTVRWCNVKLAGGVDVSVEGASRLLQYQVQLRAADPRMYSTTQQTKTLSFTGATFNTSTTGNNAGTAPSPLEIVVTAGTQTLSVADISVTVPTAYSTLIPSTDSPTGTQTILSTLEATGSGNNMAVVATATRTFYTSTRTATSLQDVYATSEFPYVYPGASASTTFSIKGTSLAGMTGSSCVFKWYDAYW